MRNWIYNEPDDRSTKLGYLRAGAVVPRTAEPVTGRGCPGGWYGIEPRGYVCVGKGATLDLDNPVVVAALHAPRRGRPLPYDYVMSREPPPHLFYKLPSLEEQVRLEGQRRLASIATFAVRDAGLLPPPDPVPPFLLAGQSLPKPYGAEAALAFRSRRGQAKLESAFGLVSTFEWTGRRWGLTTELDILPVDRTLVPKVSTFAGIEVGAEGGTPAFVEQHEVSSYAPGADGRLVASGRAEHRSGHVLTGRNEGGPHGLLETASGVWLPWGALRIPELREDPAGFAREGRKWIDVSIKKQLLVAYEGTRPVYATLVSTGRGELGDPETTQATVRGTFMIHSKHISGTMDGDESSDDAFDLRDVPYIQYFHKGYALHGAYWHDRFGQVRSHGCVNLAPADAAWLFEWTEPAVPEGWHGAQNPSAGTLVYIHG
ncbi:MAG: L,D-transpeptidase [Polyangiaceae bacterium]|nr:L,D-transpeptidase [Polyangiaceae bacterium]